MARYTGIGATIGLYEEATYGEAIKTSSLIETPDLKGGAESLSAEKEILRPEFLESTALREGDVTVLSETVSGGLMLNPRFNGKAWWAVISHLCGVNSTEAGAGPWTHTIEFGGAIDDTTAPENVGLPLVAVLPARWGIRALNQSRPKSRSITTRRWSSPPSLSARSPRTPVI